LNYWLENWQESDQKLGHPVWVTAYSAADAITQAKIEIEQVCKTQGIAWQEKYPHAAFMPFELEEITRVEPAETIDR